jgi:hypothetical protein
LVLMIMWSGGFLNRKVPPATAPGVKGLDLPEGAPTITASMRQTRRCWISRVRWNRRS